MLGNKHGCKYPVKKAFFNGDRQRLTTFYVFCHSLRGRPCENKSERTQVQTHGNEVGVNKMQDFIISWTKTLQSNNEGVNWKH